MQQEPIKLTDTTKLVRDPYSKGLLATDKTGLDAYRRQRKSGEMLATLEKDINSIRDELTNMKNLLQACMPMAQRANA